MYASRAWVRAVVLSCASCLSGCSGGTAGAGHATGATADAGGADSGSRAGRVGGGSLRSVAVTTVRVAPLGQTLDAVGLLTPKDEVRLSFKVGGLIETLPVEEGQAVKAGQLLAELRSVEVGASLEAARQAAAKASRDLARGRALFADGVATEEQVQDLATLDRVAAAGLASAQFNAAHARIVAASDGVVLRKLAEVDELVTSGQTVLVLGGAKRGWIVRVGLADRDAVRVRLGDVARIRFDAWPGRDFDGRVSNIASAADAGTGTIAVELAVDPTVAPAMNAAAAPGDVRFVQGLVAKVSVSPRDAAVGRVVPVTALIEANDREASVLTLQPESAGAGAAQFGVVHRVTIQIGRLISGSVEVVDGLEAGAQVVTEGGAFLENGERVRVVAR
jgi:RND family efflux transporter MFP subunit